MSIRLLIGDCRQRLAELPDESVHCVVTSPPYFGLRAYLPEGHASKHHEIGLEATPAEFVAVMVEVFREVKRVLRPDGVMFLNLGDAYSSGVANVPDLLTGALERGVLFFGRADPRGRSSERIHVLIYDKAAPNLVFEPLLRAHRVSIKQGQDDLCQVGRGFDAPVECWISRGLRLASPDKADGECFMDVVENVGVIVTAGELDSDAALRAIQAVSFKNRQASFAVEVAREPMPECVSRSVAVWDTFTLNTRPESRSNVDPVDESVALLDAPDFRARRPRNLTVRRATGEHLTLDLQGRRDLCFVGVSHLFLFRVGLTPYSDILDKANRQANAQQAKQELGIPDLVKRALMEDGWICRQTIIWSKPNPMPESVTDRCTKAHEYLFLLSKSPRYHYDAEAIAEAATYPDDGVRVATPKNALLVLAGQIGEPTRDYGELSNNGTRNRRSVWTVATQPFKEAHFATFPPDLIEPCIKAGCPKGGVVLDPFGGAGTTGLVADRLQRDAILIELNGDYLKLAADRITDDAPLFATVGQ